MSQATTDPVIQTASSLQCYFKDRIEFALDKQHLDKDEDTLWYLTQLLCSYSKTNRFLDDNADGTTFTPLAEYYRLSIESTSPKERRLILQRLGDVAMVVAGLFSGSLRRKAVGVDYYISMGEAAYGTLAEESTSNQRERSLQGIFGSLAECFEAYVIALSEVPERNNKEQSLLQLIDKWESTGHPAIEQQLRNQGVILLNAAKNNTQLMH